MCWLKREDIATPLICHLSRIVHTCPVECGAIGEQSEHVLCWRDTIASIYSELQGSLEGVRNLRIEARPGLLDCLHS